MKENTAISRIIKEWVIPIAAPVIIVLLINKFILLRAFIPSGSMYPTIKVGDRIVASRIYDASKFKRGDIIVFYSEERKQLLVKRLIGLPGDTVKVDTTGQVTVNGTKLEEPYIVNKSSLGGDFSVPEGKYLFLGDNRESSLDARMWKEPYIDKKDIKGKAMFIMYPFKRFGRFVIGQEAVNR